MSALYEPCLVLNCHWQAITCITVRTAIEDILRDQASVLHPVTYQPMSFDEWCEHASDDIENLRWIATSSNRIPAPEVIVLKKYGARPPAKVGFNRNNLWKRDKFTCQYCGDRLPGSKLQIEHIMPRSRGGPTSWENCVAACNACNSRKADKTPQEAGMRLLKRPTTPSWEPKISVPRGVVRSAWKPFLAKEGVA